MRTRWLSLTALAALLLLSLAGCRHTLRQRRAARSDPLPERLQVWEGEGGQNQQSTPATPASSS